jgi:hypothetical protein
MGVTSPTHSDDSRGLTTGTGTIMGTVLGCLIIGVLNNGLVHARQPSQFAQPGIAPQLLRTRTDSLQDFLFGHGFYLSRLNF